MAAAARPLSAKMRGNFAASPGGGLPLNGPTWRSEERTWSLFPEPLEPVCELRATITLVRESCDEKRERLGVSGDPERSDVQWIETHVADQLSSDLLGAQIVAAVHQGRAPRLAPGLEHAE